MAEQSADDRLKLLLALIAACAGVFGALVGGFATYLTTTHSENQRLAEDRRDERREAYSQFYGDVAALASDLALRADLVFESEAGTTARQEELNTMRAELDDQFRSIAQGQALVALLGPEEVEDAGFNVVTALVGFRSQVSEDLLAIDESRASLDRVANGLEAFSTVAQTALESDQ